MPILVEGSRLHFGLLLAIVVVLAAWFLLRRTLTGFEITVRSVVVNAGAGFLVALTGAIFRMPGLPRKPMALGIELQPDGEITGLE